MAGGKKRGTAYLLRGLCLSPLTLYPTRPFHVQCSSSLFALQPRRLYRMHEPTRPRLSKCTVFDTFLFLFLFFSYRQSMLKFPQYRVIVGSLWSPFLLRSPVRGARRDTAYGRVTAVWHTYFSYMREEVGEGETRVYENYSALPLIPTRRNAGMVKERKEKTPT